MSAKQRPRSSEDAAAQAAYVAFFDSFGIDLSGADWSQVDRQTRDAWKAVVRAVNSHAPEVASPGPSTGTPDAAQGVSAPPLPRQYPGGHTR